MIDTKTKLVLSILAKECKDGGYKIVEGADIIMSLPKTYRMDSDAIRHILLHLEHEELISIKYDDEGVYCLAVLPYGFEILENEKPKNLKFSSKPQKINFLLPMLYFLCAFAGAFLACMLCHFVF